jgi:hypothetical protein
MMEKESVLRMKIDPLLSGYGFMSQNGTSWELQGDNLKYQQKIPDILSFRAAGIESAIDLNWGGTQCVN